MLAIHDDQIERYGESPGVRDMGQLEVALFRPTMKTSSQMAIAR